MKRDPGRRESKQSMELARGFVGVDPWRGVDGSGVRLGLGSRAGVTGVQRARMLGGAARVVAELGYGGMSVARVASCAGVSRRTFYEVFEDREDCFIALFDDALARAIGVAREASLDPVFAVGRDGWRGRVRAGLSALLGFVEDEPELGSLLVVGALGGGPKVLERRARAIETVIAIVDEGRVEVKAASGPPPLTAEGVVGAVLSVIHARLLEQAAPAGTTSSVNGSSRARARGAPASLIGLLNPLMGMIVLPYLGRAAAAKELARPVPKISRASRASRRTPRPSSGDPLEGIDMRLTYRTLRVLSAIAELGGPGHGPSNRQIAQAADVHDQGQISKLLARLERLGLIHNSGAGQPRGEPNAWGLTDRGTEVEGALRL